MAFDSCADTEPGWSARNEYWLAQSQTATPRRLKRSRRTEPLILAGHGVSLNIQRGVLHVRNGFTHYPQERETFQFFRGDLNLPPRIIMLDGSGSISFDVLAWLAEQRVALVQLGWRGDPVTVIGGAGYAGDAEKIAWQRATKNDPARRLEFSTGLIRAKLAGSIEALSALPPSPSVVRAKDKIGATLTDLAANPPADVSGLRGIEGSAGATYFAAWSGLAMKWKSTTRYPIPETWRSFEARSAIRAGKPKNIRASHPINAMLNYAYAALQSRLQIEVVGAGYDPTIGIMHHGYKESLAYIFDLMEPERPKMDRAVLRLALSETFTGADFVIAADGSCRLAPQLARRVISVGA